MQLTLSEWLPEMPNWCARHSSCDPRLKLRSEPVGTCVKQTGTCSYKVLDVEVLQQDRIVRNVLFVCMKQVSVSIKGTSFDGCGHWQIWSAYDRRLPKWLGLDICTICGSEMFHAGDCVVPRCVAIAMEWPQERPAGCSWLLVPCARFFGVSLVFYECFMSYTLYTVQKTTEVTPTWLREFFPARNSAHQHIKKATSPKELRGFVDKWLKQHILQDCVNHCVNASCAIEKQLAFWIFFVLKYWWEHQCKRKF